MLKLLSPLFTRGRNLFRQTASLSCQPTKLYSQELTIPAAEEKNLKEIKSNFQITNESKELDKLYSRLELELRGSDAAVMKSYSTFVLASASHLGIKTGKCWNLRQPDKDRYSLRKSAFVHKRHWVQYEIRTFYTYLNFRKLTGSTLLTFLEYIERNLPEGVAMKTTKVEVMELPVHLQKSPIILGKSNDSKQ